jgi:hypothetical protein
LWDFARPIGVAESGRYRMGGRVRKNIPPKLIERAPIISTHFLGFLCIPLEWERKYIYEGKRTKQKNLAEPLYHKATIPKYFLLFNKLRSLLCHSNVKYVAKKIARNIQC